MAHAKNGAGKGNHEQDGAMNGIAFRGNRHAPDLWARLLPSGRAKMIDAGLFTPDGKITRAGLEALKDMD